MLVIADELMGFHNVRECDCESRRRGGGEDAVRETECASCVDPMIAQ